VRRAALALALGLGAACVRPVPVDDGAAARDAGGAPSPRPLRREENVIASDEIRETPATNVYQLIEKTRPQFLRPIPGLPARINRRVPLVYVNERRYGPLEALRTMQTAEVVAIRRLTPSAAGLRYGPDAEAGIIEITTRAPR